MKLKVLCLIICSFIFFNIIGTIPPVYGKEKDIISGFVDLDYNEMGGFNPNDTALLKIKNLVLNKAVLRLIGEVEYSGEKFKINIKGKLDKSALFENGITGQFEDMQGNFDIINFSVVELDEDKQQGVLFHDKGKILRLYLMKKDTREFIVFEEQIENIKGNKHFLENLLYMDYEKSYDQDEIFVEDFWYTKIQKPVEVTHELGEKRIIKEEVYEENNFVEDGSLSPMSNKHSIKTVYWSRRFMEREITYQETYNVFVWGIPGSWQQHTHYALLRIVIEHDSRLEFASRVRIFNKFVISNGTVIRNTNNITLGNTSNVQMALSLNRVTSDMRFTRFGLICDRATMISSARFNIWGVANAVNDLSTPSLLAFFNGIQMLSDLGRVGTTNSAEFFQIGQGVPNKTVKGNFAGYYLQTIGSGFSLEARATKTNPNPNGMLIAYYRLPLRGWVDYADHNFDIRSYTIEVAEAIPYDGE